MKLFKFSTVKAYNLTLKTTSQIFLGIMHQFSITIFRSFWKLQLSNATPSNIAFTNSYRGVVLWKFINPVASNLIKNGVSTQVNKMSSTSS